jgi:hypothetical protein
MEERAMSSIVALKLAAAAGQGSGAALLTAAVLHTEEGHTLVRLGDGSVLRAQRAKGCLVKPEANDLVLAVDAGPEGIFILAVLAGGSQATCLSVDGDLALEAKGGALSLSGRQVTMAPREAVAIQAPFVRLEGDEGRLRFRHLSVLSRMLSVSTERAEALCERLDMAARQVFQRVKNIFRRVEGLEETRAGRISLQSQAGVDVRGGRVTVISDADVKIDGRGFHIG